MPLPVVSGRGFLISPGVDLKFGKSGMAYARLPLSFKNSRKSPDGTWTHDKEILIEGTVFGKLAEFLCETVTTQQELYFSGEVYIEEYEGKKYVKANIHTAWPVKESVGSPVVVGASPSRSGGDDLPF